ncbi:MAG: hypothetical protein ACJA1W_004727 [Akkermansiaceae bacterium]|jgi:hypothetical protein
MGPFEDEVIVGAAGEEGLETPSDAVAHADLTEVVHGLHLFCDGATNGGSKHGFEIHMEAGLGGVEGFFERGLDNWKEGFDELGVVG